MELKINEIFYSIQGESTKTGYPSVFVRTSGCPLRCFYCDTTYAYHQGTMMSMDEIFQIIEQYPTRHICITGGEPMVQKSTPEFCQQLLRKDWKVSVETSGAYDCRILPEGIKTILDVKTPDSGEVKRFEKANLELAHSPHEFKFVICSRNDFEWAENFCSDHKLYEKVEVLFSPSHSVVNASQLAQWLLDSGSNARLQIQLHKFLWPNRERGI